MEDRIEPEKESPSPEAMLAFAAYFRENPCAIKEEASLLAKKFSLPTYIIEEVLEIARNPCKRANGKPLFSRTKQFFRNAFQFLTTFIRIHPIFCSFVLGLSGAILISFSKLAVSQASLLLVTFGTLIGLFIFLFINFIRAQMRYAFSTSMFLSFTLVLFATSIDVLSDRKRLSSDVLFEIIGGTIFLTFAFFALASFVSILGGILQVRKEWIEESRRNRLHLLQQLFDLQTKLVTSGGNSRTPSSFFGRNLIRLRKRWWIIAILIGFALLAFRLIQAFAVGLPVGLVLTAEQSAFAMFWILLQLCAYPLAGFIAGTWSLGIASAILIWLITSLTNFFDAPGLGWQFMLSGEELLKFALLLLLSATGGAGGTVEEVAQRKRRIASADHSAILAEILRLQGVLGEGKTERCAMVLDCVRSTEMKENADPLTVEISFSAFHEFVRKQIETHGGFVRSIAGDGVVAFFDEPSGALSSARAILASLPDFNKLSNRLSKPFRVRIGIHCGTVYGNAEQIQFAHVIDVAAHTESLAPPNSIVVTEPVRMRLSNTEFIPFPSSTEGQSLYLVESTIKPSPQTR